MIETFLPNCVFVIVGLIIAVGCFLVGYIFHCGLTDKRNIDKKG